MAIGAPKTALAEKLGFEKDQVVLELGWDEDVDDAVRDQIEELTGSALEDDDYDGVGRAGVVRQHSQVRIFRRRSLR